MEKELKHIKLIYTDKDKTYLDKIVNILEVKTRLIVELFGVDKFSTKEHTLLPLAKIKGSFKAHDIV